MFKHDFNIYIHDLHKSSEDIITILLRIIRESEVNNLEVTKFFFTPPAMELLFKQNLEMKYFDGVINTLCGIPVTITSAPLKHFRDIEIYRRLNNGRLR